MRKVVAGAVRVLQLAVAALLVSLLYPAGTVLLAYLGVLRLPAPDTAYLPGATSSLPVSYADVFGPDMQAVEIAREVISAAVVGALDETHPWRFNTSRVGTAPQERTIVVSAWRPCAEARCAGTGPERLLVVVNLASPSRADGIARLPNGSAGLSNAAAFTATWSSHRWEIAFDSLPSFTGK